MKKLYNFVLMVIIALQLNAQCPLTTAVDFTLTDINGIQHNLFSYLDSGKYVMIDFFYTACVPCQQTAPKVNMAYEYFGCNTGNLRVIGIDTGDDNASVLNFDQSFGAHYPAISGVEGGGTAVVNTYQITAFPTVILIAPDKSIVEQDIWPIADGAALIAVVAGHGLLQHSCTGLSTEASIIDYSVPQQSELPVIGTQTIDVTVTQGTDVSALVPTFTISAGATAKVNNVLQESGVSAVDFTAGPVTYTITAEDGATTQDWLVTIHGGLNIDLVGNQSPLLWPNPAKDIIHLPGLVSSNISISDITGKTVMEVMQLPASRLINVSNLLPGVYFIAFNQNDGRKVCRFSVVK